MPIYKFQCFMFYNEKEEENKEIDLREIDFNLAGNNKAFSWQNSFLGLSKEENINEH